MLAGLGDEPDVEQQMAPLLSCANEFDLDQ
jgi:hypothetical protein